MNDKKRVILLNWIQSKKKIFDKIHPVILVKQTDKWSFVLLRTIITALTWENSCWPCIEKMFENNNYINMVKAT